MFIHWPREILKAYLESPNNLVAQPLPFVIGDIALLFSGVSIRIERLRCHFVLLEMPFGPSLQHCYSVQRNMHQRQWAEKRLNVCLLGHSEIP